MPAGTRPSSSRTSAWRRRWRCRGPSCGARSAVSRRGCATLACGRATAWALTCPTRRTRWWPSWPAPASVRCGRCVRRTWARWPCSTASGRSRRACWWPSTARSGAVSRTTGGRCCARCSTACPRRAPRAAGRCRRRGARRRLCGAGPRGARLRRLGGRRSRHLRGGLGARLAALRPSAVGGLLERHHRAAQGHRARPRRHRAGDAQGRRAAQRHPPSAATGERFHWFSSTGWIMWNAQVGALLGGTTICLYDGNPGGRPRRTTGARCGASSAPPA